MDVIKTSDLKAAGVPRYRIDLRCRPGGPWQRILPGVLLLGAAPPTRADRVKAALAYAGPEAVLTGVDALHTHGLPDLPLPPRVHVLQPAGRRRSGDHHVLLERTTRLPRPVHKDGLPLAPPARAVLDAARHEPHPTRAHGLLTAVLRSGLCSPPTLLAELDAGSKRGAATPRSFLRALTHH
ncbi:hypothetical protein [Saccharothrix variisporea]|uniref:AbiEi antitoxin C-terminal domain-containing protein n=1 Tax=Saccharothrix variisporea TaxID=543527 RepID=A0A495XCX3_9PSEU|nr:hypothetical protein [Saccharothrix variisporea]RKT70463.1 hypothetical protein DFJ66_3729 [Saccharothrix variisporea]